MVPTVKDPNVRVPAATLRSPTIEPHIQIEIDSSREGMWLLRHFCTPANPVRVREAGGRWEGRREEKIGREGSEEGGRGGGGKRRGSGERGGEERRGC